MFLDLAKAFDTVSHKLGRIVNAWRRIREVHFCTLFVSFLVGLHWHSAAQKPSVQNKKKTSKKSVANALIRTLKITCRNASLANLFYGPRSSVVVGVCIHCQGHEWDWEVWCGTGEPVFIFALTRFTGPGFELPVDVNKEGY